MFTVQYAFVMSTTPVHIVYRASRKDFM